MERGADRRAYYKTIRFVRAATSYNESPLFRSSLDQRRACDALAPFAASHMRDGQSTK